MRRLECVAGTVKGLFYGAHEPIWAELVGVVTCFITLSILSFIAYFIARKPWATRVGRSEIEGSMCRDGRAATVAW